MTGKKKGKRKKGMGGDTKKWYRNKMGLKRGRWWYRKKGKKGAWGVNTGCSTRG
jgi:hypothetical protein